MVNIRNIGIYDMLKYPFICIGLIGNALCLYTLLYGSTLRVPHFLYYRALTIAELFYCITFAVSTVIEGTETGWINAVDEYGRPHLQVGYLNVWSITFQVIIARLIYSTAGYMALYMSLAIAVDRFSAIRLRRTYQRLSNVRKRAIAFRSIFLTLFLSSVVHSWDALFQTIVHPREVALYVPNSTTGIAETETSNNSYGQNEAAKTQYVTLYVQSPRKNSSIYNSLAHIKDIYNLSTRLTYPVLLLSLTVYVIVCWFKYASRRHLLHSGIRRTTTPSRYPTSAQEGSHIIRTDPVSTNKTPSQSASNTTPIIYSRLNRFHRKFTGIKRSRKASIIRPTIVVAESLSDPTPGSEPPKSFPAMRVTSSASTFADQKQINPKPRPKIKRSFGLASLTVNYGALARRRMTQSALAMSNSAIFANWGQLNHLRSRREIILFYLMIIVVILAFVQVVPREIRRLLTIIHPPKNYMTSFDVNCTRSNFQKFAYDVDIEAWNRWLILAGNVATWMDRSLKFYFYIALNPHFRVTFVSVMKSLLFHSADDDAVSPNRRVAAASTEKCSNRELSEAPDLVDQIFRNPVTMNGVQQHNCSQTFQLKVKNEEKDVDPCTPVSHTSTVNVHHDSSEQSL